ncbi:glycoside hydrolase family 1 protein [Nocardia mangyaensis]|uniref:glycoside hydrolase family 1 protein n=1 Tax=Nocardia mangyaensis TaxID=2213200 RepID=UPI0026765D37|nr:family 1 glycosylhydrolase [Nocardia mangyaensis]MDO3647809.1 family 1 glycosylhydrolase [Nocardia mangyaensis]
MKLPDNFLWGAATSPHQTEGNNLNSDWWTLENGAPQILPERSGDAVDSYHRYHEDMTLLGQAGLNAYRFGVEWARIEPTRGQVSRAMLDHYRRMIDTALDRGLTPVVTLHHFTGPAWFAEAGGWTSSEAVGRFSDFVTAVAPILMDVPWVCTINEPNMVAIMASVQQMVADPEVVRVIAAGALPEPDPDIGRILIDSHHAATAILRSETRAAVGWSIAQQAFVAAPGCERQLAEANRVWEDPYLEAAAGDDFVGSQAYTSRTVGEDGIVAHPDHPDNTLTGWAYRPDALGIAVRHAWEVTGGTPVLVTENGIATDDDTRRIAYTGEALAHLGAAMADGVDVRGYLHWSALDNYEWGHWRPTFGLIAVDRRTFARTPKPSLAWLGDLARANMLPTPAHLDPPTAGRI